MNPIADFSSACNSATILVVDDEPVIRHLLDCVLSREGYRVLLAEDGAQALEMSSSEPFSILITDLCLPGITGIELATQLRAIRPELMTLFISGVAREQFSALDADMSRSAFIPKPFRMTHILDTLNDLASRQALSSPASWEASSGMPVSDWACSKELAPAVGA